MEDKDKLKDLKKRIAALGVAGSLMIGGVAGCSSINKDDDLSSLLFFIVPKNIFVCNHYYL